jgi:hypothetical protein
MSDVSPYKSTQSALASERMTAQALAGEHIGAGTANAAVGGPAFLSTAPYKPPKAEFVPPVPLSRRTHGCIGRDGTCRVGVVAGTNTCVFHRPGGTRGGDHQSPDVA